MAFSLFGLGIWQIVIIVIIILAISAIFFRRYTSALVSDFIIDPLLSFADLLLFGAGAIGLDIGDWIAAFIIYKREKKVSGGMVALFAAWEATNFLPVSLIPVVGEVVEFFTNFFPAVFISRLLFNKYRPAEDKERKLEKDVNIAKEAGIEDIKAQEKALQRIKDLIKQADPVDAIKDSDRPLKEMASKLIEYTDNLIADAANTIQYITSQNIQAPQELINILEQGIGQGTELLQEAKEAEEKEDFEKAINSAVEAKNAVVEAAQQFDYGMQMLQQQIDERMQMQ